MSSLIEIDRDLAFDLIDARDVIEGDGGFLCVHHIEICPAKDIIFRFSLPNSETDLYQNITDRDREEHPNQHEQNIIQRIVFLALDIDIVSQLSKTTNR